MVVFTREFNILSMYRRATPEQADAGAHWYDAARKLATDYARRYGVTKQRAAGVIAALSPQVSWKKNQDYARTILEATYTCSVKPRAQCLYGNWDKAWKIANGTDTASHPLVVLKGPKVLSFYRNICGKGDRSVTVDSWASRVAVPEGIYLTPVQYRKIADAYTRVADMLDTVPAHVQATCWIAIRGTGE
jgi:hypothetical protein